MPRDVLADLPGAVAEIRSKEGELLEPIRSDAFTLDGAKQLTGYR